MKNKSTETIKITPQETVKPISGSGLGDSVPVKNPFPDVELTAVGFEKVPNKKGVYMKYTFTIKNNQVIKSEYGTSDDRYSAEADSRSDFVRKLVVKD